MTEENEKFMVISTKVSPFVYERIHRIAKKKGMKAYKLNQMVLDTLVRYMDDRHNLSEEMEHAMSIFEHMIGWKDALNLADPATEKEIGEAVYVLCDPEGKKKGTRAVMVHKPYFGDWNETQNVVDIFERMVEVLLPDQYRKLRKLAVDMDCNNLVELYTLMIDSYTIAQMDSEAIRKEFEDCNRSDYGKPVQYGNRTKRKHHKNLSIYERSINFEEEGEGKDKDKGPELGKDFQPFGCEY